MAIDVAAWYEKYGPMVIRRCKALLHSDDEAMDAVQDVFINLIKAKKRLRPAFPSSLLYTMATNVCLNRLRGRKREAGGDWAFWETRFSGETQTSRGGFFPGEQGVFSAVDSGYEQVDAELLVDAILEDESEETRTICYMYHADGMTLKEIGEAVGLSVSGVWKRLEAFRGRAQVKLGENLK